MKQGAFFKRANHSNLGKEFEAELSAVHDWYRMQGWADVVQNPNEWRIIGSNEYQARLKSAPPGALAVCNNGLKMARSRSDVDFSGGGEKFSVCWDAKQTGGNRFPISSMKAHQIDRLVKSAKCGTVAGFMIKFTELDRVFFLQAGVAREFENRYLRQAGKVKRGTASISVEQMEENATEIFKNKLNRFWDWLPIMIEKENYAPSKVRRGK